MPHHLYSISDDQQKINRAFAWIITHAGEDPDYFINSDGEKYIQLNSFLCDEESGERFGKCVLTQKIVPEKKVIELLDLDITLDNPEPVELLMDERLFMSTDANEYYNVIDKNGLNHLQIETVNRYKVKGEIEGTVQQMSLSAFPFEFEIFSNVEELNKWLGFESKTLEIEGEEYTVHGFGTDFTAQGDAYMKEGSDETYTIFTGVIEKIEERSVAFGDERFDFAVVEVKSGAGNIPVAVSPEVFDLDNLAAGRAVFVKADIKADFEV